MRGVPFGVYQGLEAARRDSAVPRLVYLDGDLEIVSPGTYHEIVKKVIARLLEAWAEEHDVALNGYGSWTIKQAVRDASAEKGAGLEPDECYIVGPRRKKNRPDLAIEVVHTHGHIRKLEIYRRLKVPEVWIWDKGQLRVHVLQKGGYAPAAKSKLLPGLDLAELVRFIDLEDQTGAVKRYRKRLQRR